MDRRVKPGDDNRGNEMDISSGYQIETPTVFVPWGIDETGLSTLLADANPRHVTDGYWTIECVSLGGLSHMLGFHFEPRSSGMLVELELFHKDCPDLAASFAEFQHHLEDTFGPPSATREGDGDLPSYLWDHKGVTFWHLVQYRFGLEEHVRFKWNGRPA